MPSSLLPSSPANDTAVPAGTVLDVDNLGSGTLNSMHIDISGLVLCFCTSRFFTSGPCAQEVVRTWLQRKPMFALLEPDALAGGLSEDECRAVFRSNPEWPTETKPRIGKIEDKLTSWKADWRQPRLVMPTSAEVEGALFTQPPVIWSRLSAFQDVSLRLIAERLLRNQLAAHPSSGASSKSRGSSSQSVARTLQAYDEPYTQLAYMQGEIAEQIRRQPIQLTKLREGRAFHLYCSAQCAGAAEVSAELQAIVPSLRWTDDVGQIEACEQCLIYLTSATWTSGEASAVFAHEVAMAMRLGVRLTCAHETLGARSGDTAARKACAFADLFDWTPSRLLKCKPGVYGAIAMNLAGGEWREAGLIMLAQQVALGGGERSKWRMAPAEEAAAEEPPQLADVRVHIASSGGDRIQRVVHGAHRAASHRTNSWGGVLDAALPPPSVPPPPAASEARITASVIQIQAAFRGKRVRQAVRQAFLSKHQSQRLELMETSADRKSLIDRPERLSRLSGAGVPQTVPSAQGAPSPASPRLEGPNLNA